MDQIRNREQSRGHRILTRFLAGVALTLIVGGLLTSCIFPMSEYWFEMTYRGWISDTLIVFGGTQWGEDSYLMASRAETAEVPDSIVRWQMYNGPVTVYEADSPVVDACVTFMDLVVARSLGGGAWIESFDTNSMDGLILDLRNALYLTHEVSDLVPINDSIIVVPADASDPVVFLDWNLAEDDSVVFPYQSDSVALRDGGERVFHLVEDPAPGDPAIWYHDVTLYPASLGTAVGVASTVGEDLEAPLNASSNGRYLVTGNGLIYDTSGSITLAADLQEAGAGYLGFVDEEQLCRVTEDGILQVWQGTSFDDGEFVTVQDLSGEPYWVRFSRDYVTAATKGPGPGETSFHNFTGQEVMAN